MSIFSTSDNQEYTQNSLLSFKIKLHFVVFSKINGFLFFKYFKNIECFFCNNIKPIVRIQKRVSKSSNYIKRIKKKTIKSSHTASWFMEIFGLMIFLGFASSKIVTYPKKLPSYIFFFLSGLGTRKNSKIHATSFNFSFYMVLCFELL